MGLATKSYSSVTLVRKYKTYHDCLMTGKRIGLLPRAHMPTAGHVFLLMRTTGLVEIVNSMRAHGVSDLVIVKYIIPLCCSFHCRITF